MLGKVLLDIGDRNLNNKRESADTQGGEGQGASRCEWGQEWARGVQGVLLRYLSLLSFILETPTPQVVGRWPHEGLL